MLVFVRVDLMEIGYNTLIQIKVGVVTLVDHRRYHDTYSAFQHYEELVAHFAIFAQGHRVLVQLHGHLPVDLVHSFETISPVLVLVAYVVEEFVLSHEILMHQLIVFG